MEPPLAIVAAFALAAEGDPDPFAVEPPLAIGELAVEEPDEPLLVLTLAPPGVVTTLFTLTVDKVSFFPLPVLTIRGPLGIGTSELKAPVIDALVTGLPFKVKAGPVDTGVDLEIPLSFATPFWIKTECVGDAGKSIS